MANQKTPEFTWGNDKISLSKITGATGTLRFLAQYGFTWNVLHLIDNTVADPTIATVAPAPLPAGADAIARSIFDHAWKVHKDITADNRLIAQSSAAFTMLLYDQFDKSEFLKREFPTTNPRTMTPSALLTLIKTCLPIEIREQEAIHRNLCKPFKLDYGSTSGNCEVQVRSATSESSDIWTHCATNGFPMSDGDKTNHLTKKFFGLPMFKTAAENLFTNSPNAPPAVIITAIINAARFIDREDWKKLPKAHSTIITTDDDVNDDATADITDEANAATKKPAAKKVVKKKPASNATTCDFYCWTHGPNKSHMSINCHRKGDNPAHKDAATMDNKLGGRVEPWTRKPRTES